MKKNSLLLIIGQFTMFIGFVIFLVNYFFLDSNLSLVFVTIIVFVISMVFNLTYLVRKMKEKKLTDN